MTVLIVYDSISQSVFFKMFRKLDPSEYHTFLRTLGVNECSDRKSGRILTVKIDLDYLKVLQRNKRCYSVKVEDWIDINTNSEYDTCELRNHLFYQKKNEYEHSSLLTRTNALLTWNVGSDTLTLDTWLVWMWLQESPGPWGRRQQVSTGRPSASKSSWRETLLLN